MPFLDKFKNIFRGSLNEASTSTRGLRLGQLVKTNVDPETEWQVIEDIGDGAFGKVQKAQHRTRTDVFAAAKVRCSTVVLVHGLLIVMPLVVAVPT